MCPRCCPRTRSHARESAGRWPVRLFALATIVALACASPACGRRAVVELHSGEEYHLAITRSDTSSIYLDAGDGREVEVERTEIADIDHPGVSAMGIGALLCLLSIGPLWATGVLIHDAAKGETNSALAWFGFGGMALGLAGPGIGLIVDGERRWSALHNAARHGVALSDRLVVSAWFRVTGNLDTAPTGGLLVELPF